jgi:hypothetical protein
MVGLVASGPEVERFVLGKMAFEGPDMRRDIIFRICLDDLNVTVELPAVHEYLRCRGEAT